MFQGRYSDSQKGFMFLIRVRNMRNLYISILALFSFLQIVSCTKENDDVTKVSETKEVPVSFSFQAIGGLTTKAGETAPTYHYAREVSVDRVKLYVYKRASDAVYTNDEEGFSLDEGKGRVLTAVEQNGHDDNTTGQNTTQPHFVAQGTLQLESGYDYRITALGYSEAKGESELFKLNNGFFRTAEVELTETENYTTPELFWGNVVTIDNDSIFSYETATDPNMELSGWLYRGVAGVELTLSNVPENVQSIELMADSINIKSKARYYDDFLETYEMKKNTDHTHYLLGKWERGEDMQGIQECEIIGPNLFDICTSLSLRIKLDDNTEQYARLRIKEKEASSDDNVSGQSLGTKAIPGDGGNGTGIIPGGEETPEEPGNPDDPNKNPFTVCFKRNNYYQIEGDYEKLMTNELNITVIVNPNWDADVSLTLGEAQ